MTISSEGSESGSKKVRSKLIPGLKSDTWLCELVTLWDENIRRDHSGRVVDFRSAYPKCTLPIIRGVGQR
jgi:hypothetical protein